MSVVKRVLKLFVVSWSSESVVEVVLETSCTREKLKYVWVLLKVVGFVKKAEDGNVAAQLLWCEVVVEKCLFVGKVKLFDEVVL